MSHLKRRAVRWFGLGVGGLAGWLVAGQAITDSVAQPSKPMTPPPAEAKPAEKAAEPASAKPVQAAGLPSGKEVLEKFVESTGGRGAYEKVKNRRMTGTMEMPAMGMKGSIKIEQAAPNLMKVSSEIPGVGAMEQGTDGTHSWQSSAMTGPMLSKGDAAEQAMALATFNADLRPEALYESMVTTGLDKVDGKDCYVVVLTPKRAGQPETRFYDKESGLLLKSTMTMASEMGELKSETTVGDWKDVDGVKQPHLLTISVMSMQQIMKLDKIEQNVDFPADYFAPPADIKTLIEKESAAPAKTEKPEPTK